MQWDKLATVRLENDAVLLRPITAGDKDALGKVAFNPDIWRYFIFRIDSEDDLDRFVRDAVDDTTSGKRLVFCVIDKARGQIAGSMAFGNLAEKDKRVEIGWSWLGKAFQGTGINGWAKFLILQFAFEELGCERVEFKTDVLNLQARKGLLNIGAKEEGVLRSYNFMPDGRRRDAIYYSILRNEWPAAKAILGERLTERFAAASISD